MAIPVTAEFVSLTIGSYLLGSIPTAYLVAKRVQGIDLRQYGSGNVGATNLLKLTSRRIALPVIVFDSIKGVVMVCVAYLLGFDLAQQAIVGLAAIIGHNWSAFLRFSGGRGIITAIGVGSVLPIINWMPAWAMVICAIIAISGLLVNYTPVGVTLGVVILPLMSWELGDPFPLVMGYTGIMVIVLVKRLAVKRSAISAEVDTRELLLNRLFFDRDIRDREAWINRTPDD